ncbi:alpha/beta hydrolase [Bosea sp. (in: a-proteobacteria)]|jgi:arylformamidase|uniref:alpha/beta hydrolase n=1 Tax=Bosea sp. (in: a-proteobacteria) TaxID=1871050 RepID=UPI002DDD4837|nr:alpha/beta hydrolase [Bosea sp. (in: a-proteobacteria)]HEV2508813.1 alpha/beta hydrolase [Bosea sp. (in: a-proteobacteria)]
MALTASEPVYRGFDRATLDREYNARESVASFDAEYAKYASVSAQVQREHERIAGIVYDEGSGETLDFYPAEPGAPLFLWVHGGYWRASSKDDNAFVVPGPKAHGFAVAVMNYTLAPQASLDEIVRQTRAAVAFLHARRAQYGLGSLAVGGSSAGGHLVGMLLAGGWQADFGLPDDAIRVGLALSGLHDIEPLRSTHVDAWLCLDDAAIARNSPIRHIPRNSTTTLLASVGGLETSEFRRQTADYAAAWIAAGHRSEVIAMPRHNHFDIALDLASSDGVLAPALAAAMGAMPGRS